MIKNFVVFLIGILMVIFFAGVSVHSVSAVSLNFEPSSVSTTTGSTFTLKINVDPGTEKIVGTDVHILYDADVFEVQSVVDGTYFPTVINDTSQVGKAYINALTEVPNDYKTGKGTVASIVFKSKTAGTGEIVYDCTEGSTSESNIARSDDIVDIIDCSANGKSTITIAEGTGGITITPTNTPTSTPTTAEGGSGGSGGSSGSDSSATSLPETGIFDNILKYSIPGVALVILGTVVKLFL